MKKKAKVPSRTFVLFSVLVACCVGFGLSVWLPALAGQKETQYAADAAKDGIAGKDGKVTIVSVPGWSFLDWNEETLRHLPNISGLIRDGAIGGMNVRTPEKGLEDSYATMGAGAPAFSSAGYLSWNAVDAAGDRTASELYRRLTGLEPHGANIVVPEIAAIRRRNDNRSQHSQPGLLGESLRRHGIAAGVFGNSDTSQGKKRYAPLLIMDENGLVPIGDVGGNMTMPDPGSPYEVRTSAPELLRAWDSIRAPAVSLLEWGDLWRFQAEQSRYAAEQAEREKIEILRRLDHLVGEIVRRQRSADSIWLLSPFVGPEAARNKMLLAPVVHDGPDVSPGLLLSPSTRREGIVTASDFAPSILASFGIEASNDMVGRAMTAVRHPDPLAALMKDIGTIGEIYRLRPRVLIPFVSVEATVLLAALVAMWVKLGRALRWIGTLLLALLAAPFSLLLLGWLNAAYPLPGAGQLALFVALTGFLACLFGYGRSAISAAGMLSGITVAALLLDGMLGAEGMKHSVLGYDPMIGARYYGMGNEYMGVVVGAATLAFAAALERRRRRQVAARAAADSAASPPPGSRTAAFARRRRSAGLAAGLAAAAFAAVTLYLAAPGLGTNAGGAITAAVAFGLAWLRSFANGAFRRLGLLRLTLVCGGLVAASLGLLWLLNAVILADAGRQSHIGRAMGLLGEGRADLITATVLRKLQMNVHLIGVSVWTKVLAAGLLVMAVAVVRPRGAFRRWEAGYPHYMSGFIAIAVGSVAALAFNDSGIVAAATMIVYAAVPMLLLRIQEDSSSHSA
ncbi:hypothetical protein FE783_09095 [Paenibacillus mesophilus]|uniref:hypothetical protein n=1 Tax=Paenibacillus mesophilus TaxID=2582849 RepID=UPI00110E9A50|nr:hypothetical protein [Paenibacillus mesophilus]TMV50817.1 hypothetical protein FE783_09095 [Paenibacillus mesophilus]